MVMSEGFDAIAGEATNSSAEHLSEARLSRSNKEQQQTAVPPLFTNLNVTVWKEGKEGKGIITVPIRAKIKITAAELKSDQTMANKTNRAWVLTSTVTLARIDKFQSSWNLAAAATYDVPHPPTADGWIYPNFLWLMTGCGDFEDPDIWNNDYGIMWMDSGAAVNRTFGATRDWHGIMGESKKDANATVDMVESSPVDVVIRGCPNKGVAKVLIFYADFRSYFNRDIPKLPPPWGLYLLHWELSEAGELTFQTPIEVGEGETIPENWGDAFKQTNMPKVAAAAAGISQSQDQHKGN